LLSQQAPHLLSQQAPHLLSQQAPHLLSQQAPHLLSQQSPLDQLSLAQPPPQFMEVIEVQQSRPMLSRQQKIDLMEDIIEAAGFKPRQVSRMLRQKSKQSKRSKTRRSKL
jgi:hypothetical protein